MKPNKTERWEAKFVAGGGYDCITDAYQITNQDGDIIAELDLRYYEQRQAGIGLTLPSMVKAAYNAAILAGALEAHDALRRLADAAALANEIQHNRVEVPACVWADLYQATNEARAVLARLK